MRETVPVPPHLSEPLRNLRHDLHTPLNNIIGLSDMWADALASDPAYAELCTDLEHIRDAAWRLHTMLGEAITETGFAVPIAPPSLPTE